jgi:hypothetical protein
MAKRSTTPHSTPTLDLRPHLAQPKRSEIWGRFGALEIAGLGLAILGMAAAIGVLIWLLVGP